MDPVLITLGLLLIASAITLMWSGARTWLLAIAQGVGMQAVVGALVAGVQVVFIMPTAVAHETPWERVQSGVQALPFNAAGWAATEVYQSVSHDPTPGVTDHLEQYLPIAAAQVILIGMLIATRRVRATPDRHGLDPVQLAILALIVANSLLNVQWAWWGN
jgi:membrane-associated PAP2 superfamily phosphatase